MSKDTLRDEKVIIACTDANGGPTMVAYRVSVTQDQYDQGDHYEHAKEKAMNDGYEGPFICFDNSEHLQIANVVPEMKRPVRIPYFFQDGELPKVIEGEVEFHGNGIEIYVKGYGSLNMERSPVAFMESWDDELRLVSYGDYAGEEPTNITNLEGAKVKYL